MDLTITVVKQNFHCLPDAPPDFEYTEIGVVGVDGFVDSERSAEIRRAQEIFVRLKPVEATNRALLSMNVRTSQNSGK